MAHGLQPHDRHATPRTRARALAGHAPLGEHEEYVEATPMSMHADVWSEAGSPPDLLAMVPGAAPQSGFEPEARSALARAVRDALSAVLARRQQARPSAGGYLRALARLVEELPREPLEQLIGLLSLARRDARRVFVLGTDETAALASAFASDLSRIPFGKAPPALRAVTLLRGRFDPADVVAAHRCAHRLGELAGVEDVVIAIAMGDEIVADERLALEPVLDAATRSGATTVLLSCQGHVGALSADLVIGVPTERREHVQGALLYIEYLVCAALRELERSLALHVAEPSPRIGH